jgi:hypothetical protein
MSETYISPPSPESFNSSVESEYGFHPSPRKAEELIPNQAAFLLIIDIFLEDIYKAAILEERHHMIIALFKFLLQPQFAAYHLGYADWRQCVLNKSAEFLADPATCPTIRGLCRQFQELYSPT